MPALDTNVLVRFLVEDDAAQLVTARNFIQRAMAQGQTLFVPITVFLELEWVLRSRYRFDKAAVIEALGGLLSAVELSIQHEAACDLALWTYGQSSADFSDCLHISLSNLANETPFITFDHDASKLAGAQAL